MTGILAEIGRGNMSVKDLKSLLSSKSHLPAKYTAPPSGLFLEQVIYKGDNNLKELVSTFSVSKFKNSIYRK
jgi:tRNA pseudouridine38-40 synthase